LFKKLLGDVPRGKSKRKSLSNPRTSNDLKIMSSNKDLSKTLGIEKLTTYEGY